MIRHITMHTVMSVFGPPLEAQKHGATVFRVDVLKDADNACRGQTSTITMDTLNETNLPHVSTTAFEGASRQCYEATELVKHLQSVNQDGTEWGKLGNRDPNTNMSFTASQRADIFASTGAVDDQTGDRVAPASWMEEDVDDEEEIEEDDPVPEDDDAMEALQRYAQERGVDTSWLDMPLPPALFPWAHRSTWDGAHLDEATPLAAAVGHGFVKCVHWLLSDIGANAQLNEIMPVHKTSMFSLHAERFKTMTMLNFALDNWGPNEENQGEIAHDLVAHGANVSQKGLFSVYLLPLRCSPQFEFLIKQGTNINILIDRPSALKVTPLYILAEAISGHSPMDLQHFWTTESEYIKRATTLIDAGADCALKPSEGALSVVEMLTERMTQLNALRHTYMPYKDLMHLLSKVQRRMVMRSDGRRS